MPPNYLLRFKSNELEDMETDDDASSSIGPFSSPYIPAVDLGVPAHVPFININLPSDDDGTEYRASSPATLQRRSKDEKAAEILAALRAMPDFSLKTFLETVFTSDDSSIKNSAGVFHRDGGPVTLMQLWFAKDGLRDLGSDINQWVIDTAGAIGGKELSRLTEPRGPHTDATRVLRVRAQDANVKLVQEFRLHDLRGIYDTTLPNVQRFFKALIGKDNQTRAPGSRNVDDVCATHFSREI
ncbi:hypothetical protein DFH07DRAFT_750527 [Mycena maculata]|uniref:Uncharacterized protein n=1 Tax=Mycena maculata TaxID=230809 RepID=A0AAD7IG74_9AGAR|nr:hypothetical protein DFH07DRAFT_750527 [Mycena maculata]